MRPQVSPTPAPPEGPPVTALVGTSAHTQAPQKPIQTPGLYSGPPTASSSPHTCLPWVPHLRATHQGICPHSCPEARVSALTPTVPPHPPTRERLSVWVPTVSHTLSGACQINRARSLLRASALLFCSHCLNRSSPDPAPLPPKVRPGPLGRQPSCPPREGSTGKKPPADLCLAQSRSWSQSRGDGGGGGWEGHHLGPFGNMAGETRATGTSAFRMFQHQKVM